MPSKSPISGGRRIQTRRSGVHGNGVFAVQDIAEGETLIEYKGEIISWKEALRRHPHDPTQPHHTFYFHIDDDRVIDGNVEGNAARWINHSCEPNCEADEAERPGLHQGAAQHRGRRGAELRLRADHRRAVHHEAAVRVPLLVRLGGLPRHPAGAEGRRRGKKKKKKKKAKKKAEKKAAKKADKKAKADKEKTAKAEKAEKAEKADKAT